MKYSTALIIFLILLAILVGGYQALNKNQSLRSDCKNLCWNDIQVGISTVSEVTQILDDRDISYSLEGYDASVIWFRDTNLGFLSQNLLNETTEGTIHFDENQTVSLITFVVDLCPSSVISLLGEPILWQSNSRPYTWIYPDNNLLIGIERSNFHINSLNLHIAENMPSSSVYLEWDSNSPLYEINCSDAYIQNTN